MPDEIYSIEPGQASAPGESKIFYLDIHEFGPGKVTAKDVATAHRKDLAVQEQYGVNFINYWVNEKKGTVLCLSHAHAHGLVPVWVKSAVKGQ